MEFLDQLPLNLKLEVAPFIHEQTYRNIQFIRQQSSSFINWICPLLVPVIHAPGEFIYFERDEVTCIYFFKAGSAGMVLPRHQNKEYIRFQVGCYFGVSDIIAG